MRPEFRPHQLEAIARARRFAGYCLFMEQRTGKTDPSLELARLRQPDLVLIFCPEIAIDKVWRKSIDAWDEDLDGITFDIRTHESAWPNRRRLKRLAGKGRTLILVDEAHKLKNRRSKISRALRSIARHCKWRLALTGTPFDKGLEQTWAVYDFVDPEIFGEWKDFEKRYLKMGGYFKHKVVGYRNVEEYQELFNSRYYRVLLDDVSPHKVEIHDRQLVLFDLEETRPKYDELERKFFLEIETLRRTKKRIYTPMVMAQTMKLHQLAGGFILDEEGEAYHLGDEKLTHLAALLSIVELPVVIYVRFIWELERIGRLVETLGRTVTLISRKYKFESFDTDVAVIQVQSGVAIDLARAANAIFYSMNYSQITFDQAKFRIRSYDSNRPVTYYYLVGRNTKDEEVYTAAITKQNLAQLVLSGRTSMVVKKKVQDVISSSDIINVTPQLKKAREAILTLNDKESEMNTAAQATTETSKPVQKKSTKPAAKKKADAGKKVDKDLVTLTEIAESLKLKPARARRIMRASKIADPGARWAWAKGSAEIEKVKSILKEAVKE